MLPIMKALDFFLVLTLEIKGMTSLVLALLLENSLEVSEMSMGL